MKRMGLVSTLSFKRIRALFVKIEKDVQMLVLESPYLKKAYYYRNETVKHAEDNDYLCLPPVINQLYIPSLTMMVMLQHMGSHLTGLKKHIVKLRQVMLHQRNLFLVVQVKILRISTAASQWEPIQIAPCHMLENTH